MPKRTIRVFLYDTTPEEALEKLFYHAISADPIKGQYRDFLCNNILPGERKRRYAELTFKVKELPDPVTGEKDKKDYIVDIRNIIKYAPCPHDSYGTNLGDGITWAKCEECGETFKQEDLDKARQAYKEFVDSITRIRALVEK